MLQWLFRLLGFIFSGNANGVTGLYHVTIWQWILRFQLLRRKIKITKYFLRENIIRSCWLKHFRR